jgi:hypothetical protein
MRGKDTSHVLGFWPGGSPQASHFCGFSRGGASGGKSRPWGRRTTAVHHGRFRDGRYLHRDLLTMLCRWQDGRRDPLATSR